MNVMQKVLGTVMGMVSSIKTGLTSVTETVNATATGLATLDTKVDNLDTKVDNMIIESGTSDAETIASRTNDNTGVTYATLQRRLDAENNQLKADLIDISADVDSKVSKPTESPDGTSGQLLRTNGDGTTEWVDEGLPTDEQTAAAVSTWLEEHPEATTTVEDGSLIEAKFTAATQLKVLNDYVTPEMYGAVGDGSTDDTQAIKEMFASGAPIYSFGNKTYIVSDSIDVTEQCTIKFDDTNLQVTVDTSGVRSFEYILGIKAKITTKGKLTLTGRRSVNVCLWLAGCGGSAFDHIYVTTPRIWGIYVDKTTAGNNSLHFGKIKATYCGLRITAKAQYVSSGSYEISDIANSNINGNWTYETYVSIFDNRYSNTRLIIDDSGYTYTYLHNRAVMTSDEDSPFTINTEDPTKAIFTKTGRSWPFPSDYNDGNDGGRAVMIPIGGAVRFGSSASEGAFRIDSITTQNCAISISTDFGYGGTIGNYASEYDGILIETRLTYALTIGYIYLEALGNGLTYRYTDNSFNRLMLVCANESTNVNIQSSYIGQNTIKQGNEVLLNRQQTQNANGCMMALHYNDYLIAKKLEAPNIVAAAVKTPINEFSPRVWTQKARYYNSDYTLKLGLEDIASYRRNMFSPLEYYTLLTTTVYNNIFKVTLTNDLITAGYTINGAVDNVLSVDVSALGMAAKIVVILFETTFYVTAETLNFVDNTTA